jgi:hypothetical protein
MSLKYCQGPECHMKKTQDRLRGTKGNKTYQTRRRSSFYYGNGNFCSLWCQNDWFQKFGEQAVDHFGRLNEPKYLTEQNAWTKDYTWADSTSYENRDRTFYYRNTITQEQRPMTEAQFNDTNYNINIGE